MMTLRFPEGLELVDDLEPASWVREALRDWPVGRRFIVSDLVPPVFEAYARVLHRPHRSKDGREPTGTWRERAEQRGVMFGPQTTHEALEGTPAPGSGAVAWSVMPGMISRTEATTLASFLEDETSTPDSCWFAMWSSGVSPGAPLVQARGLFPYARARWRGVTQARRERRAMRKLKTFQILGSSGRVCLLFGGRVADIDRFARNGWFDSPPLWWPDDRAWFVHTEMDGTSTYIGGARSMIERLVGEQILESFQVDASDRAVL
jgi:hypothetical protein